MKIWPLLANLQFHDTNPFAEPLLVNADTRILRFMLRPHQAIREHVAPSSPFLAVVLQGTGMFAGADGQEEKIGPQSLLSFAPGEKHSIRALETDLIFVGFLRGHAPEPTPENVSSTITKRLSI